MSITNELLAHMSYSQSVQKNAVREQLEKDMAEFLAKGGAIQPIFNTGPKVQTKSKFFDQEKQRARQPEDQASLSDIKKLSDWCKARKGRGKALCEELGLAHAFISQIINQTRPCSKQRYTEIVNAMSVIESKE